MSMSDKYDFDYFDSNEYRRRQPQRRQNTYNRTAYDKKVYRSGRRPQNHRPSGRPPRRNNKRLKNRIIIVTVGILIMIALIVIIVSAFNACAKIGKNEDVSTETTSASSVAATETVQDSTDPLSASYFITPQIEDDGTSGYINYAAYIWNKSAYEIFGNVDGRAQVYAEAVNNYKKTLGENITVYDMVVPNHTEMGLPERLKTEVSSDSQAENIRQIYSFLDKSVTPINAYNKLAQHNNEYIYFKSDHHWTGLGAYYAYSAFAETTNQPVLDLSTCTENQIAGFTGSFSETNEGLDTDTVSYWTFPYNVTMDVTDFNGETLTYESPYYEYAQAGSDTYGLFIVGDNPLTVLHSDSEYGTDKKIAVVKESYGNSFVPYLTYNYSEVHIIDFRHFGSKLPAYCAENGIDEVLFLNGVMSANTQVQIDSMDSLFT